MQIKYTLDAFASLTSLLNFIESKNTQGAALRWLERYEAFLLKALVNVKRLTLCKIPSSKNYSSIVFILMTG